MKKLTEYIAEALSRANGYVIPLTDTNQVIEYITQLTGDKEFAVGLIDMLDKNVFSGDFILIGHSSKNDVPLKIQRKFDEKLTPDLFRGINKSQLKRTSTGGSIYYESKPVITIGNGRYNPNSSGMSTDIQETLSCIYYNLDRTCDFADLDAVVDVAFDGISNVWLDSWHGQVNSINDWIVSRGWNPKDYRMVRFESKPSNQYKDMVNNLKNILKNNNGQNNKLVIPDIGKDTPQNDKKLIKTYQDTVLRTIENSNYSRDNVDKADVFLYRINNLDKIIQELQGDDGLRIVKDLFLSGDLIGVSLKGLPNRKAKYKIITYNTNDEDTPGDLQVNSVGISPYIKNGSLANQVVFYLDTEIGNLELTLRSSTSSPGDDAGYAIDIKHAGKPALGKLPIRIYRGWRNNIMDTLPEDLAIGLASLNAKSQDEDVKRVWLSLQDNYDNIFPEFDAVPSKSNNGTGEGFKLSTIIRYLSGQDSPSNDIYTTNNPEICELFGKWCLIAQGIIPKIGFPHIRTDI